MAKKWRNGLSPLMHACLEGNATKLAKLLAAGEDPNAVTGGPPTQHSLGDLDFSVDDSGRSALHIAAGDMDTAHPELVRLLLDAGASVDAIAGSGSTPLCYAAATGDRTTIELLIARGARADLRPPRTGTDGELLFTPLYEAARCGHDAIVALLLARGAKVDTRIWTGATPLMGAANAGVPSAVKRLLAAGANPRRRDDTGASALHAAIETHGNPLPIVRLLLAAGADPSVATKHRETPLHQAADRHQHAVALTKLLVAAKAKLEARDDEGRTPLFRACQYERADTAKTLLAAGLLERATKPR